MEREEKGDEGLLLLLCSSTALCTVGFLVEMEALWTPLLLPMACSLTGLFSCGSRQSTDAAQRGRECSFSPSYFCRIFLRFLGRSIPVCFVSFAPFRGS